MTDEEWTRYVREFLGLVPVKDDYRLVVDGVDRHGGLQWTYRAKSLGLDRYVTIFVIPETTAFTVALIEVRAGASDGRRSADRRIGRFRASPYSLKDDIPTSALVAAFDEADELKPSELTHSYPGLLTA
ncbi:hypothetical protein ACWIID_26665 [Streptomyces phaeochromogenes]